MSDGPEWEYKLLQDKLDKIGDFQFRVKGWAVALTSATLLGGSASRIPYIYVVILAFALLAVFGLIEQQQIALRKAFSGRVLWLERNWPRKKQLSATTPSKGRLGVTNSTECPAVGHAILAIMRDHKGVLGFFVHRAHPVFYLAFSTIILGSLVVSFVDPVPRAPTEIAVVRPVRLEGDPGIPDGTRRSEPSCSTCLAPGEADINQARPSGDGGVQQCAIPTLSWCPEPLISIPGGRNDKESGKAPE